jgi:Endonuclease I
MNLPRYLLPLALLLVASAAEAASWRSAKNTLDDVVYAGRDTTFYCGCTYKSHRDSDGSGDITDMTQCGYVGPRSDQHPAGRIEWEHVVPKSFLPPGPARVDLHNVVPAIGLVNALRSNDRYFDLPDESSDFGGCAINDSRGAFEPPDCRGATWLGSGPT